MLASESMGTGLGRQGDSTDDGRIILPVVMNTAPAPPGYSVRFSDGGDSACLDERPFRNSPIILRGPVIWEGSSLVSGSLGFTPRTNRETRGLVETNPEISNWAPRAKNGRSVKIEARPC